MSDIVETHKRTIARMISYRLTAWLFTIFWTYLFLGNIGEATGFATVLHILLSVDYYIHERIWLKIKWGFKRCDC
jgi:adenylylsulfate kinase